MKDAVVKNMDAYLEKLHMDAEECALISKLATDLQKQEYFARLADHLKVLALDVQRAITAKAAGETRTSGP